MIQLNKGDDFYMKSLKRGFTLIELLIVIAMLGALAVGLLATINPVEQLRKGRDTSTRSIAVEFYNANQRNYAYKLQYGWTGYPQATAALNSAGMTAAIAVLVSGGELKSNFLSAVSAATLSSIYVTSTAGGDNNVCFAPQSNGFKADPNSIYNISGATGGCTGTGSPTSTCYYCLH